MERGMISDIKRFAVHDGAGIRTTVFFKGCPLKCVWCHNPESIGFQPQIAYYENKCIGCMECVAACSKGAQLNQNGRHSFAREKCIGCGQCEFVCLGEAIKHYGEEVTVEQLLPRLLEDSAFFKTSGGGVTLSGGECLCQASFCAALLKRLKAENIHTAVDTCGFVAREAIDQVLPYTDIFLYDLKAIDDAVHIKCTGRSNRIILENLQYIDASGKPIEVRIPYVPQYNDHQIERIAAFLKPLRNITAIKVLPYHHYASARYGALGMVNTLPERLPTAKELEAAEQQAAKAFGTAV